MALDLPGIKNLFKTSGKRDVGLSGNNEQPAGHVRDKEYTITIPGVLFTTDTPDIDDVLKSVAAGTMEVTNGTSVRFIAGVTLPDKCKILSAIMYGNDATEIWSLKRGNKEGTGTNTIFSSNLNSSDSSVGGVGWELVDNSTYGYFFHSGNLEAGDHIDSAQITYIFEDPDSIE